MLGGFFVVRRRAELSFDAPRARMEDVHERIAADEGSFLRPGSFRIRMHGDGRLRARFVTKSRAESPPYFRGRVAAAPAGVHVSGVIHESRGQVLWPLGYSWMALFMAAVAILVLVLDGPGNPGFPICGVGAILFFGLSRVFVRIRQSSFDRAAELLEQRLREVVAGDA